jgi:hypothetical protein
MPNLDTVASEIMRNLSRDTGSDFEFLAQLFEDINLDTGSGNEPQKRLMAILDARSYATHGGITHFVKPSTDAEDRGVSAGLSGPASIQPESGWTFHDGCRHGLPPQSDIALTMSPNSFGHGTLFA